jgi:hypothetical protein
VRSFRKFPRIQDAFRVEGALPTKLPASGSGRIRALPPNAIGMERGCVQSTSRSTWKSSEASGIFQLAGFAKLLRLVFDTAALRDSARMRPLLF